MIKRYTKNEINELVDILKQDGVISVPTDTVYGLCARINSIKAYNNLIVVKSRPINKPFPIMCANEEQIKSVAIVDCTSKPIKILREGSISIEKIIETLEN